MSEFYKSLLNNIVKNANNNYSDNYDAERFGQENRTKKVSFVKTQIKKRLFKDRINKYELSNLISLIGEHGNKFALLYNSLEDQKSKDLLIDLISYRILGYTKVKLNIFEDKDKLALQELKKLADYNDFIDPKFQHFKLYKFDLKRFGKDVNLYFTPNGVMLDFFKEQYKYTGSEYEIAAQKNDVVIDAGGCWGDTALYFADRVGSDGKVYSFEFIPNNIKIFKRNCEINPRLKNQITLIEHPLWDTSGKKVYYKDYGPGSKVSFESFQEADGTTETISIDDFVEANNISRIDFIKMDIEGAEPYALEGARKVIMRDKPKLVIAIYHSPEDFVNIPKWILDLNLGYKLHLGHSTIHEEETVIFATTLD